MNKFSANKNTFHVSNQSRFDDFLASPEGTLEHSEISFEIGNCKYAAPVLMNSAFFNRARTALESYITFGKCEIAFGTSGDFLILQAQNKAGAGELQAGQGASCVYALTQNNADFPDAFNCGEKEFVSQIYAALMELCRRNFSRDKISYNCMKSPVVERWILDIPAAQNEIPLRQQIVKKIIVVPASKTVDSARRIRKFARSATDVWYDLGVGMMEIVCKSGGLV